MQILDVCLSGDWAGLFEQLPGWACRDGVWQGSGGGLRAGGSPSEEQVLVGAGQDQFQIGAQGITASKHIGGDALRPVDLSIPSLIHVAINSPLQAGSEDFERAFRRSTGVLLPRAARYDPAEATEIEAMHCTIPGQFYLTQRYFPIEQTGLDHIGFECLDPAHVEQCQRAVQAADLEIVVPPGELDGSYLFHFRGPDGRVHDFYTVLA
ncbi:MAG: hypothetical protein Hens2KO_25680 [Henriciella sp.]